MQDQFSSPSCFSSGNDDGLFLDAATTKSGQSMVSSVYLTKISSHCRLITVTWCRNLLVHGLSVSVEEKEVTTVTTIGGGRISTGSKVDVVLRPWHFWRKQGSKCFLFEGEPVYVFWDLRAAKFSGDPEPDSGYYVAVVSDDEVVLLLGDLKEEALRRSGTRPAAVEAILVSKKEHVFGKKKFSTKAKFHKRGKFHYISIECSNGDLDPEMVIRVDGKSAIHVKHLQWKFRGNESISINKTKVEVYWDIHDWLFCPGLQHALFIFKPTAPTSSPPAPETMPSSSPGTVIDNFNDGSSDFCLFLYAWKVE